VLIQHRSCCRILENVLYLAVQRKCHVLLPPVFVVFLPLLYKKTGRHTSLQTGGVVAFRVRQIVGPAAENPAVRPEEFCGFIYRLSPLFRGIIPLYFAGREMTWYGKQNSHHRRASCPC